LRIGIDVGGTNTDAVIMDGREVVAWHKTPTTPDVTGGIVTTLDAVCSKTHLVPRDLSAVMIGTTHFTNAIVEIRRLLLTAAIRVALPATQALPPMVAWPQLLREAVEGGTYLVHGGSEYDGRDLAPFDEQEVRAAAADIRRRGVNSVAITSVFSPVNPANEELAARIVQEELPGAFVTLSNEIGRLGLLERENAAILNGCLRELAAHVVGGFRAALKRLDITAPLFITQNDGTLMSSEFAERYPVLTFASGPTNSMRGAAFLSGRKDAVVVDIGGTTTDVGILVNGFPRETAVAVEIGGVRTNFRMPDVLSIGLGGGSVVHRNGAIAVGPESVGYELERQALVFGGDTLTATDAAVFAGLVDLGDRGRVASLERGLMETVIQVIHDRVNETIGRVKTSAAPAPVVLVGGGAVLVGRPLSNSAEVVRPPHAEVANAIGAAIAQVGGQVDRVLSLAGTTRQDALKQAKAEAIRKAVAAGASQETVQIIEVDDVPLTYLPGNALRIRVRAVGDLRL